MKKIIALLLTLLLSISLFACVAEEEGDSSIDDYAAPNYTHRLTAEQGGGTLTFTDGHAESAIISDYTGPSQLHSVTVPAQISEANRDVTGIGEKAFYQTPTIKTVVLPETVTFIGELAFAGCTALETIVIPASVTYIDQYAFYGCTALKSVVFLGQELESIGDFAFLECTALETIVLPEGLESIGNWSFGNCKAIKTLAIPSTVKTIGTLTFSGCEGLDAPGALTLSASITDIGEFAFAGINKNNITAPAGSYAADYVAKMAEEDAE